MKDFAHGMLYYMILIVESFYFGRVVWKIVCFELSAHNFGMDVVRAYSLLDNRDTSVHSRVEIVSQLLKASCWNSVCSLLSLGHKKSILYRTQMFLDKTACTLARGYLYMRRVAYISLDSVGISPMELLQICLARPRQSHFRLERRTRSPLMSSSQSVRNHLKRGEVPFRCSQDLTAIVC